MSITKRTFLIVCCIFTAVLLALSTVTYLLFYSAITRQLVASQEAMVGSNARMSVIFTQMVDQLVYDCTSDEQLGELLASPIGQDELEDLNLKYSLNGRISSKLHAQTTLLSSGFRLALYLNPQLEVSRLFRPDSTIENVGYVFSGESVAGEDWYKSALKQKSGQFIFVDEEGGSLCFARRLQNSGYTGPYRREGVGVLLGSLPLSSISNVFPLSPVTENSGFLLVTGQGDLVFRSEKLQGVPLPGELSLPAKGTASLTAGEERYLCSSQRLQWGLQYVFLTPYGDITWQVWGMMVPYLVCSAIFLAAGVGVSLVLSKGLSRPVVRFTRRLEAIQDTRGLDWEPADPREPLEIQQLNRSFGSLIGRVNALIREVTEKETLRRESDLRALQAQINPHFMLNAMNAVNYMALEREQDDIASTVASIANLMRYSITEPDSLVTMGTELDNIREYIAVYALRFRQDIRVELLPGLPSDQVVIPKFTLQPLVENSIRHGITRRDQGISVFVRAYQEGDSLRVDVTDTGVGADAAKLNAYLDYQDVDLQVTHGFGIRNVNERLKLRFPQKGCLRYCNYQGGRLLARITLPAPQPGEGTAGRDG